MLGHRIDPTLIVKHLDNIGYPALADPDQRWREYLISEGATGSNRTALEISWLKLQGYTGTLADMLKTHYGSEDDMRRMLNLPNTVANRSFETDITGYTASGYALNFDGVDDRVAIVNPATALTDDLTISLWVNFKDLTDYQMLVTKTVAGGSTNNTFELRKETTTNSITFIGYDTTFRTVTSATALATNRWYHVTATKTAGVVKIYLDGVEDGSGAIGTTTANTSDIQIGTRDSLDYYFDGKIKNTRIWNTALTATEVTALYNGTDLPQADNLVAEYLFENGSGLTLTDTAGSNNGTITGATWVDERPTLSQSSNYAHAGTDSLLSSHNMISNYNFEVDTSGWIAYAGAVISQTTEESYIGTGSLKGVSAAALSGGFAGVANTNPHITTEVGVEYEVTAYVKSTVAGGNGNLYIGSGTTNSNVDFAWTTEWQKITNTFLADATTTGIYLRDYVTSHTSYWDNVQIRKVEEVPISGAKHTLTGLTIGQVYTLSAYFYQATDTDYCGILLPGKDQSGVQSNGTWRRVQVAFTATATTQDAYFVNLTGSNPFYLDQIVNM